MEWQKPELCKGVELKMGGCVTNMVTPSENNNLIVLVYVTLPILLKAGRLGPLNLPS